MRVTVKIPSMTWHRRAGRDWGLAKTAWTCMPTLERFAHNHFALKAHTGRINSAWKRVREQLPRQPPALSKKVNCQQWTRVHQIVNSSGGTCSASRGSHDFWPTPPRGCLCMYWCTWGLMCKVVWVFVCVCLCFCMQCNVRLMHLCACLNVYVLRMCWLAYVYANDVFVQFMHV